MSQTLTEAVASYPAEMPDWAIADDLNMPRPDFGKKRVNVAVSDARGLLMQSGAWASTVLTAEDASAPVAVRAAAITARDSMTLLTEIATSDPAVYAATEAMLSALPIDATLKASLLALAEKQCSWADINNNGIAVTARDVGLARGGLA